MGNLAPQPESTRFLWLKQGTLDGASTVARRNIRRWIAPTQPCLVNLLALVDVVSNKATARPIVQRLHPNSATIVRS